MPSLDIAPGLPGQIAAVLAVLTAVSNDLSEYRALDEAALLAVNSASAEVVKCALATATLIAGEVARRSAPELGDQGLARRLGHRTPEQLIKVSTGSTGQQATTAVRVGRMVQDSVGGGVVDSATGEVARAAQPWLVAVADGVLAGTVSIAAAEAIDRGPGLPTSGVTEADLAIAARALSAEAIAGVDADSLFRRAHQLRDQIDIEGISEREAERRRQRSLTSTQLPNGMSRLVWVMDPETAASVKDLYDRAASPKRGGVRFVDPEQSALADAIRADNRTPAQLASDAFEHLLRVGSAALVDVGVRARGAGAGADAAAGAGAGAGADGAAAGGGAGTGAGLHVLLGSGAPVIHIAATRAVVDGGRGAAHIRGQVNAVSVETLERLACTGSHSEAVFDADGIPLDLGRDQRLFTAKQKQVLALRWGGCVHPGCERPPSWAEAHHIEHWGRDHGQTNIADGVLLCKHHHLLYHHNGWEIRRDGGRYWLVPPGDLDREQRPIELVTKSRVLQELLST